MATVDIKNLKNEVVGKLDLADEVFGGPINEGLLHDAVKQYLASQRSRHAQDEDPRRSFRQRQETVEAKGHGPRARRRNSESAVAQGRHRVWSRSLAITSITCRERCFAPL